MHPALTYPFDGAYILKKRRAIRRELTADESPRQSCRIAILGGTTTHDIREITELFLLDAGILPEFYESEYGGWWQEGMFGEELRAFRPDVVFIHTGVRDIRAWPRLAQGEAGADALAEETMARYEALWDKLGQDLSCAVISNNFEKPTYRVLGNRDAWDGAGRGRFISLLNARMGAYARSHPGFYIHDVDYLSSDYGLSAWQDPKAWHLYKYSMAVEAIPAFAHSLAVLIAAVRGKSKKALALDLDNTLWGGVVGDDGPEGIVIGHETSEGQIYSEFQQYLKDLAEAGVLLNVISKNDRENALAGIDHPEGTLRREDFVDIIANWEPKGQNLARLAKTLSILPESIVFVDDNPAERLQVHTEFPGVAAPPADRVEDSIRLIDRAGYFEPAALSADDLSRGDMLRQNLARAEQQAKFADYDAYLRDLAMHGEIRPFAPVYMARIAQLTNKSNQFNLTTRRFTEPELAALAADDRYICLYGKLTDRFGDNGVVSVMIGEIVEDAVHLRLFLMSCRVLKRQMEQAMLDRMAALAAARGANRLVGYYYPTPKNGMVRELYPSLGFAPAGEDGDGTVWSLPLRGYTCQNNVIEVDG